MTITVCRAWHGCGGLKKPHYRVSECAVKGSGVVRKEGLTDTLVSSVREWEGSKVANRPDQCAEVAQTGAEVCQEVVRVSMRTRWRQFYGVKRDPG